LLCLDQSQSTPRKRRRGYHQLRQSLPLCRFHHAPRPTHRQIRMTYRTDSKGTAAAAKSLLFADTIFPNAASVNPARLARAGNTSERIPASRKHINCRAQSGHQPRWDAAPCPDFGRAVPSRQLTRAPRQSTAGLRKFILRCRQTAGMHIIRQLAPECARLDSDALDQPKSPSQVTRMGSKTTHQIQECFNDTRTPGTASSASTPCSSAPGSRSTMYRKVEQGTFPRQVRISERCVGWRESAIKAWLRNPMFYCVEDDG
ncbi:MAG: AlpA family transcriptional regulator, partial [Sphingomonas bacterium]|nr:AlpA family transcriptional regulator [Sphingomonas bacterium]